MRVITLSHFNFFKKVSMINRVLTLFRLGLLWAGIPLALQTTLAVAASGAAHAQTRPTEAPLNARKPDYSSDWECNPGFQEKAGACVAIAIPENAYATKTSYGRGWECDRGYRRTETSCLEIAIPANASLTSFGDQWSCFRGFRKTSDACVAIAVPSNGYLSDASYGEGWECGRGYRPVDGACAAIVVPANGFATNTSHGR